MNPLYFVLFGSICLRFASLFFRLWQQILLYLLAVGLVVPLPGGVRPGQPPPHREQQRRVEQRQRRHDGQVRPGKGVHGDLQE